MKNLCIKELASLVPILLGTTSLLAAADAPAGPFLADLTRQVAAAEKANLSTVSGRDGWMFFVPELRALSIGPFWGEQAIKVSRASKTDYADPLPAITDFNDQLRKAGIELIVVPVPAKAAVYSEAISMAVKAADGSPPRLDPFQQEFYRLLTDNGVTVLDLMPLYLSHRHDKEELLYCKTDTHWSGRGLALAAQTIVNHMRDRPWLKDVPKAKFASQVREVEISGDLARMLDEKNPARETLSLTFVGAGNNLTPIEPDRDSPVLLIGDSHTLVFHDPTLHARGAGLPDHLAHQLGFAVDLIGVRGSGATTTRVEVLRRRDNLKGKKVVVWCFSFREFTESFTGWRKVPVIR
jgi:hypothetical protein